VFAFPFLLGQQPLGLLVVDEKTNARPFTKTDIQLLTEITTNIALVINQVSLKDQLLQAKELELLGRMSQGMAHDLNNLTTPVWTLLQLLTEGVSPEALRTDLAPVAMRNIQTMREYIREALFFSENLRPDFQTARLDTLVQEVVDLARQNKRKGKEIIYTLQLSGEILVEMDRVLIRRLLSNVLSNAVDASQPGGRIDIEILRLMKTDLERDWFRVRVTDHGSGIASENIHRIFQPYFTTKKTGDEERGFGLGLAICRKIATLHGGSLVLSSEVGKGTVVNLDLPSHYKALKALRPSSITKPTV
jgi:signal transduction histidine kinase